MPETSQTYLLRVWCDDEYSENPYDVCLVTINPYDVCLVTISPAYARQLLRYRAGWLALEAYGCDANWPYTISMYDYTPELFGTWEDWDEAAEEEPNRGLFYTMDHKPLDLEEVRVHEVVTIQPAEIPEDVGSPLDYSRVQIDRRGVSWECRANRWTGTLTTAEIPWDIIATLAQEDD